MEGERTVTMMKVEFAAGWSLYLRPIAAIYG